MDTSEQMTIEVASQVKKRQKRPLEEKRRIVEETLAAGASVARVARRHAVNANQVFYWRKKYREGRLGKGPTSKLLPVTLSDNTCGKSVSLSSAAIYSLLGTAKLNGIDPESYLRNVSSRIASYPINRIEELLPWNVATSLSPGIDEAA